MKQIIGLLCILLVAVSFLSYGQVVEDEIGISQYYRLIDISRADHEDSTAFGLEGTSDSDSTGRMNGLFGISSLFGTATGTTVDVDIIVKARNETTEGDVSIAAVDTVTISETGGFCVRLHWPPSQEIYLVYEAGDSNGSDTVIDGQGLNRIRY